MHNAKGASMVREAFKIIMGKRKYMNSDKAQ